MAGYEAGVVGSNTGVQGVTDGSIDPSLLTPLELDRMDCSWRPEDRQCGLPTALLLSSLPPSILPFVYTLTAGKWRHGLGHGLAEQGKRGNLVACRSPVYIFYIMQRPWTLNTCVMCILCCSDAAVPV